MAVTAEYDVNIEVANVGNLAIAPGKVTEVFGVSTAGNFGVGTVVAESTEQELTTTSATSIASFTPTATGMFLVGVYFRVVTAATTVTITITYDDVTGAQTITPVNAVSEAVDSYTNWDFICATTSAAITVTATAGTASQVYVSSSIIAI